MKVFKNLFGKNDHKIHVDEIAVAPGLLLGGAVIVESGITNDGDGYYVRYGDGTQIVGRRVVHDFSHQSFQHHSFPKSFLMVYGIGFGFAPNSLSGDNSGGYWNILPNTVALQDSAGWRTLTRNATVEATAYIYLTAFGRWK